MASPDQRWKDVSGGHYQLGTDLSRSSRATGTGAKRTTCVIAAISVLEIVYPLRRHSRGVREAETREEPCVSSSSPKGTLFVKSISALVRAKSSLTHPSPDLVWVKPAFDALDTHQVVGDLLFRHFGIGLFDSRGDGLEVLLTGSIRVRQNIGPGGCKRENRVTFLCPDIQKFSIPGISRQNRFRRPDQVIKCRNKAATIDCSGIFLHDYVIELFIRNEVHATKSH